jgi:hypothetical protein
MLNYMNALIVAFGIFCSCTALGQHAQINLQRATSGSPAFFVSQGIEGEYGSMRILEEGKPQVNAKLTSSPNSELGDRNSSDNNARESAAVEIPSWRCYSLRTGFGTEMFKALRLGAWHSLVSSRRSDDEFESISGSRFSAEGVLTFTNPLANITLSYGASLGTYRYQKALESAQLGGNGSNWSLGAERFFSSSAAVSLTARTTREQLQKTRGAENLPNRFGSESFGLSLAIALWM